MRKGSHLTDEQKAKQREAHLGQTPTEEQRRKISEAVNLRYQDPAERLKVGRKGRTPSAETRALISAKAKERYADPAEREKQSQRLRGLKRPYQPHTPEHVENQAAAMRGKLKTPEHIEKTSAALRLKWQSREYRERWARAVFSTRTIVPNKDELALGVLLDREFPGVYRFNDFAFTVYGKIPDFVDEAGHRIIELYGEYWHREHGQTAAERIRLFVSCGYRTLVVWDYELQDEPTLVARLRSFQAAPLLS